MNWFKHDSNATTDFKIKKLIMRYGAIGYAIYFHCLELIANNVSEANITFELEHDAEIIADDLRIRGDSNKSGIEIVEEIMRFMVDLDLFEENNGHIFCFKLLKRLDTSMTSNPKMRAIISEAKNKINDDNMIESCKNHDEVMTNHDSIMQDKIRIDKNRLDNNIPEETEKLKKTRESKNKYGEFQNVLLTLTENNKLTTELGAEKAAAVIQNFSQLKEMKGYKYKSDYLAIRNWGIRAYEESLQREKKSPSKTYTPVVTKPIEQATDEELKVLPF